MKQYLLAVHTDYGQPMPPQEEMQQAYESVGAFNAELKSAGAWVFAGGLHPPSTATVVRSQAGKVITTDDPRSAHGRHRLLDAYKNGTDVELQVSQ